MPSLIHKVCLLCEFRHVIIKVCVQMFVMEGFYASYSCIMMREQQGIHVHEYTCSVYCIKSCLHVHVHVCTCTCMYILQMQLVTQCIDALLLVMKALQFS